MVEVDEVKHKSRRDDSERKEDSRRSDKDRDRDRLRDKERNGERYKDRDIDKKERDNRRTERERSVDDKYREKHRDKYKEREKGKTRSRDRDDDRERVKDKDKDREGDTDREDREKEKEKEKEREKDRESREKERKREREDRARDKEKEREQAREREKEKEREKREHDREEKEREREKREREKADREREKKEKEDREREREREREKRERDREHKERERERERRDREREDREAEKERERDRRRGREKRREVDRDSDDERDNDRKRRRREEDYRVRERESSRSDRHRDDSDDSRRKRSDEDLDDNEKRTREENLEEEQRKLDEEMDKRRRRVQEWQELRRKKEEAEREKRGEVNADEPKSGKNWTLEGESDDEEAPLTERAPKDMDLDDGVMPSGEGSDAMMVDSENSTRVPDIHDEVEGTTGEEEIDPLDAFMNSMVLPEVEKLNNVETPKIEDKTSDKEDHRDGRSNEEQPKKGNNKAIGRIIPGVDSDSDYGDLENDEATIEDEDDEEFMKRVKKTKAEKLSVVDHSKIQYPPFRKNFYIEVKEISRMTSEEVAAFRKQLELKIHGKDVPKPIKTWHQTGLSSKILDTIKKHNFEKPMPIQAQALPIIMSGRDCIGVAKTGSGKTLAFVLPMLRHIKDQPPVVPGDGPIGLIMAPTRELVQQIHSDIKKFAKGVGLNCVPVYGGSGVAQQISELKRGTEIVVCTPGRMIDILCTSGGKITNLRRVTYLVMDEADRMFDMGFEPQITRIVQNTRPDRQTVLFSATFPRQVEILARKVLNKPVEIQVGGRSVVNKDITQLVEVRPEIDRFLRLLELLGEWYEKGKILIFVHSQEKCDSLFKDLLRHGYPCLSLHGAKDQTDRETTISDFKSNVCNLLIATSVAARGLDVKELELVINFDVPNHYEDYVHRVGRTGRAGRKGCSITFISEEDARYAPDLVKALELSEQAVPDDLKALADGFMAKVNQGLEQAHGTGYGGSGFKFNEEEDEVRRAAKKAQAREYGFEEDKSDSDDEDEGVRKAGGDISQQAALAQVAAIAAASKVSMASMQAPVSTSQLLPNGGLPISGVLGLTIPGAASVVPGASLPLAPNDGAARAAALAAAMNLQHNLAKIQADAMPEHYEAELEINDFPQNARWKVTHKETLGPISEWTGAAITTRGQYFPPGKIPGPGERKLYLFIEGPNEISVKRAKAEVKRVLEDITNQASSLPGTAQPGKYHVV